MAPGRDYTKLHDAIRSYGTWAHALESVWIVSANSDAAAIRDYLSEFMDSNDRLVVVRLQGDWATFNVNLKVANWMKSTLSIASAY